MTPLPEKCWYHETKIGTRRRFAIGDARCAEQRTITLCFARNRLRLWLWPSEAAQFVSKWVTDQVTDACDKHRRSEIVSTTGDKQRKACPILRRKRSWSSWCVVVRVDDSGMRQLVGGMYIHCSRNEFGNHGSHLNASTAGSFSYTQAIYKT